MTEQELKDVEAYQASPSGTAAALVFELERVTQALDAVAGDSNTVRLLLPEIQSIAAAARCLHKIRAATAKVEPRKTRA